MKRVLVAAVVATSVFPSCKARRDQTDASAVKYDPEDPDRTPGGPFGGNRNTPPREPTAGTDSTASAIPKNESAWDKFWRELFGYLRELEGGGSMLTSDYTYKVITKYPSGKVVEEEV